MSDTPKTDEELKHRVSTRQRARLMLADRLIECVGPAPMTFIADPQIPLLTAELLIRDLIDLGWTPPPMPIEKIEPAPTAQMEPTT